MKINLNNKDILDSKDASLLWGSNYVRLTYKQNPSKFPNGNIRKFGNS